VSTATPSHEPRPRRRRATAPAGEPANRFEAQLAARGLARPQHRAPTTLQVNLHGPRMQRPTVERLLAVLAASPEVSTVDILGGAELSPHFQRLVNGSLALGRQVVLRCLPELLEQPDQRDLADFLAVREVTVIAPVPVEPGGATRARALTRLNALGYGQAQGDAGREGLRLHLTYKPQGAGLAEPQEQLEAQLRASLRERYGLVFDRLYAQVNMPIDHFAQELEQAGRLAAYRELLERAFNPAAAERVMCRDLVSVDWDGRLADCDFNRALGLPLAAPGRGARATVTSIDELASLAGAPVTTGDHCLGCAAGQGSGCAGALVASAGSAAG